MRSDKSRVAKLLCRGSSASFIRCVLGSSRLLVNTTFCGRNVNTIKLHACRTEQLEILEISACCIFSCLARKGTGLNCQHTYLLKDRE